MTFVENDQTQYVFFLIQKLQVQAQTFYAAGCSLGWQRAGAHGRADATRRRPICNFPAPLYGARHATVCSKPASAEASAASKTSTLGRREARGSVRRREAAAGEEATAGSLAPTTPMDGHFLERFYSFNDCLGNKIFL